MALELTEKMMTSLGREVHHATATAALQPIFETGLSGMGQMGTMSCPVLHFDPRWKNMQQTGKGNEKQDVIISYDGIAAVPEAWAHGQGAYINSTVTIIICNVVDMRRQCLRVISYESATSRPIALIYSSLFKNVPPVGV